MIACSETELEKYRSSKASLVKNIGIRVPIIPALSYSGHKKNIDINEIFFKILESFDDVNVVTPVFLFSYRS